MLLLLRAVFAAAGGGGGGGGGVVVVCARASHDAIKQFFEHLLPSINLFLFLYCAVFSQWCVCFYQFPFYCGVAFP